MPKNYLLNDISNITLEGGKITSIERVMGDYEGNGWSAKNLPPMLIVNIESSYGKDSLVRHRLWLPDDWNGIFLGIGNGGYAGRLGTSMYLEASEGYAVAQTDMGSSALVEGDVDIAPEALWLDYGHRATHGMAEVAKELIFKRYGKAPEYSYFRGGSAGGKQAFMEFQRYPEDFDGIVAAVPSNNAQCLKIYFLWCYLKFSKNGAPLFTDAEKEAVYSAVLEFFAERGLAKDGYITYGWVGENTVELVMDYIAKKCPALSAEQLTALREVYDGPKNATTGRRVFCGMPFGAEINSSYFGEANTDGKFGFPWFKIYYGKGFEDTDFDFDKLTDSFVKAHRKDASANSPNLHAFKARGGKIICYSGGADPLGPWPDAMKYYNTVCDALGGYENVKDFFKFFVIPGRGHGEVCRGLGAVTADESGTTLLDMLRAWHELGIEPSCVVATKTEAVKDESGNVLETKTLFTEKIYPYEGNLAEGKDFPPTADQYYINDRED